MCKMLVTSRLKHSHLPVRYIYFLILLVYICYFIFMHTYSNLLVVAIYIDIRDIVDSTKLTMKL